MLRGHGPAILEAVPRGAGATITQILADLEAKAVCRAPCRSTVTKHLRELVEMGCVAQEGQTYRRLVESEFDLPMGAEA